MEQQQIENLEIELLAEALFKRYGYDFRHYAKASLARRINGFLNRAGLKTPSELIPKLLYDKSVFEALVYRISVTVTEMFRDPRVYKKIREKVIPYLKTYPYIKIWNAGCATGEEAYSMAILLTEEGLYERSQIYATDMNNESLARAKRGIFDIEQVKQYTRNHINSGGTQPFSNYYRSKYDTVIMDRSLKKNIVFTSHNLTTDHSFGQMHFIMCRNVLIYFNQELQNRVLKLFHDSLVQNGLLCLGTKESIRFSEYNDQFRIISEREKIFCKKAQLVGQRNCRAPGKLPYGRKF